MAYRAALSRALPIVRTAEIYPGRRNGLAAYDAWAGALLVDADFPADDLPTLRQRQMVQNDTTTMVAEGRWYGSRFLSLGAGRLPALAPELLAAAALYAREHSLMWDMWRLVGGPGDGEAQARALADASVRRRSAEIVLEARGHDQRAAEHIERALAAQSG